MKVRHKDNSSFLLHKPFKMDNSNSAAAPAQNAIMNRVNGPGRDIPVRQGPLGDPLPTPGQGENLRVFEETEYPYVAYSSSSALAFDEKSLAKIKKYKDSNPELPMFFTMKRSDATRLASMDYFAICRFLRDDIGDEDCLFSEDKNHNLRFHAASREASERLRDCNVIQGRGVISEPDGLLNSSRGIVYARNLYKSTPEQIMVGLKEFGEERVSGVVRLKDLKNGALVKSPRLLLTFNTPSPPLHIWAAKQRLTVYPWVQSPRRCFKCQNYGHSAVNCRGEEFCPRCGRKDEHDKPCTRSPWCRFCRAPHTASDGKCAKYLYEKEILTLKSNEKCSYLEARARVKSKEVREGVTFAEALKMDSPGGAASGVGTASGRSARSDEVEINHHNGAGSVRGNETGGVASRARASRTYGAREKSALITASGASNQQTHHANSPAGGGKWTTVERMGGPRAGPGPGGSGMNELDHIDPTPDVRGPKRSLSEDEANMGERDVENAPSKKLKGSKKRGRPRSSKKINNNDSGSERNEESNSSGKRRKEFNFDEGEKEPQPLLGGDGTSGGDLAQPGTDPARVVSGGACGESGPGMTLGMGSDGGGACGRTGSSFASGSGAASDPLEERLSRIVGGPRLPRVPPRPPDWGRRMLDAYPDGEPLRFGRGSSFWVPLKERPPDAGTVMDDLAQTGDRGLGEYELGYSSDTGSLVETLVSSQGRGSQSELSDEDMLDDEEMNYSIVSTDNETIETMTDGE